MPLVGCSKGCGEPVDVSQEIFGEALKLGVLDFSHDVCPKDREVLPIYHVEVRVSRLDPVPPNPYGVHDAEYDSYSDEPEPVLLAIVGDKVQAVSFAEGYGRITKSIEKQLEQARQLASIAEEGIEKR